MSINHCNQITGESETGKTANQVDLHEASPLERFFTSAFIRRVFSYLEQTNKASRRADLDNDNAAELTKFNRVWSIIKNIFTNIINFVDILIKYFIPASVLSSVAYLLSLAPIAVLSPIGSLIQSLAHLINSQVSLPAKLIHIFTTSGTTTANIIGLIIQSVALPLAIACSAMGVVRDTWNLMEMLYCKYNNVPYQGKVVTDATLKEGLHDLVLAGISLVGTICLFVFPPLGWVIVAAVGIYKLVDSLNDKFKFFVNPLKSVQTQPTTQIEVSNIEINNVLKNAAANTNETGKKNEETKKESPVEKTPEPTPTEQPKTQINIKSRFKNPVYGFFTKPSAANPVVTKKVNGGKIPQTPEVPRVKLTHW